MKFTDYTKMTGCVKSTERELLAVRGKIGSWDADDKPPVADYADFRDWLAGELSGGPQWWNFHGADDLFTHNQGSLGSCAGFAAANAAMVTLIHQVQMASEQKPVLVNPFVCWCKSKNGSTLGGQTMSTMALAINEYGQWPEFIAGKYSPNLQWEQRWDSAESRDIASFYQIGISEIPYSGKELAEEIFFLCKHRRAVFFGATACVSETGQLTRCGGHAQTFGGYDDATDRVGYINSWGDIYTGLPVKFATLIDHETLVRFCNYIFDPFVCTYAEAPYDTEVEPTLEV